MEFLSRGSPNRALPHDGLRVRAVRPPGHGGVGRRAARHRDPGAGRHLSRPPLAGRLYHPLLVTLLAVAGNLYMDYVNYHLYGAVMRHPRLEAARSSWVVRKTLALFQRSPFFAVWLCAWSPIPYWIVSVLAPMSQYSMRKYLFATFLGRAPRVWFFATLGLLIPVSTQVLVTCAVAAVVAGVVVALHKGPRALLRTGLVAGDGPGTA